MSGQAGPAGTIDVMDDAPAAPRAPVGPVAFLGAFLAVVVGGLSGALIGYGLVGLDCEGSCATPQGIGAVVGGVFGAVGVAVVAVLVLRALAEWRQGGTRRS